MIVVLALLACAEPPTLQSPVSSDPELALAPPIAGGGGADWVVQNHVDIDPSSGARDSFGGRSTYDGHKGTDFRIRGLPAMVQGVEVLSPAAGTVLRTRDGEDDRCRSGERTQVSPDRYCGNGMVIDHGGGFETQLCHLRKGSVQVVEGQQVALGDTLGLVGWSGRAEFPHVHITVSHDDQVLDPFAPPPFGPRAHWRASAVVPPAAPRVWATGFSGDRSLDTDAIERNPAGRSRLPDSADAVVAYAMGLTNEAAPSWHLEAWSPSGRRFESDGAPDGRAQGHIYVGKRRLDSERLEHGTWRARLQVGETEVHEWSVEVVAGPAAPSPPLTWAGCAGP